MNREGKPEKGKSKFERFGSAQATGRKHIAVATAAHSASYLEATAV